MSICIIHVDVQILPEYTIVKTLLFLDMVVVLCFSFFLILLCYVINILQDWGENSFCSKEVLNFKNYSEASMGCVNSSKMHVTV